MLLSRFGDFYRVLEVFNAFWTVLTSRYGGCFRRVESLGNFSFLRVWRTLWSFYGFQRIRNCCLSVAFEGTAKGGDSEVSKLVLCGISDERSETEAPADQWISEWVSEWVREVPADQWVSEWVNQQCGVSGELWAVWDNPAEWVKWVSGWERNHWLQPKSLAP